MSGEATNPSDMAAVIAALDACKPLEADPFGTDVTDGLVSIVTPRPASRRILDLERWMPAPRRATGTVKALDAGGFAALVTGLSPEGNVQLRLYADVEAQQLVAVLNDDAVDDGAVNGWRDHRVVLDLRPTPEWTHWKSHQGLGSQERFAEALEDGLLELHDPDAATMLDIAQTIHAHVSAKFKGGIRLQDGQVQVSYEEEVETAAGSSGNLMIPGEFVIRVRPYFGSEPFDVTCLLRTRPPRGSNPMQIGYTLVRPADVEREAFNSVVDAVAEHLHLDAVHGTAPEAVAAKPVIAHEN